MQEIISSIRKKKELSSLHPLFVEDVLKEYVRVNPKAKNFFDKPKSREYKTIIKDIRAKLRRYHGLFQVAVNKKWISLTEDATDLNELQSVCEEIITNHASTKERISFSKRMFEEIFALTGVPKSILDLGCGLNPFFIFQMSVISPSKKLQYYAYDINQNEIDLLNTLFTKLHDYLPDVSGSAQYVNLLNQLERDSLPSADICFLFKVTDILDQGKGHKMTEKVLEDIPARNIVVSFSTKTMSGRHMNAPQRNWVKLLCERRGYEYNLLEYANEIFYVIRK